MAFKIIKLYHPSHRVPSLEKADEFFSQVFGLPSVWRSSIFKEGSQVSGFPVDYCIFTSIADVFFDCIDPKKLVIHGTQWYETVVEPHLNGFGWGVEGIEEIYDKIQDLAVVVTDYTNRPSDPKVCPGAGFKDSKLFFTLAETSGIRLEFFPVTSMGSYDHRHDPSWQLHPENAKGALGIQFCSHHTILTKDLDRCRKIYVEFLGGREIHEEKRTPRGTYSIYVALADAVFEFAVPTVAGSEAMRDFERRKLPAEDVYHALTWKVADLSQTERHLAIKGVHLLHRSDEMIIVDPRDGLGIPWGFVTRALPNDVRYTAAGADV